jgi:hypothetical protein
MIVPEDISQYLQTILFWLCHAVLCCALQALDGSQLRDRPIRVSTQQGGSDAEDAGEWASVPCFNPLDSACFVWSGPWSLTCSEWGKSSSVTVRNLRSHTFFWPLTMLHPCYVLHTHVQHQLPLQLLCLGTGVKLWLTPSSSLVQLLT